ncbi:MAG TPA: NAD(P)(+) transhydrogenase (Re/Si-specific) subunit beta [bacterium]|nr:NAD(P)(+) transhydrogenase (Re/Si-specific) subunit beta [bacterium]HPO99280.1 NAD(P)(+) transhydrogenase (Re/Si-specific) subunit beta [bacterium]
MNKTVLINLVYLLASVLFIFGLKGLSHPRTAVRGNLTGAAGMLLAIVVTLLHQQIVGYGVIIAGILVGGIIGAWMAFAIRMTAMPQMVALLNGFGGGASVVVAGAELHKVLVESAALTTDVAIATAASGIIGAVTFWGSLVAYAKLEELMAGKAVLFPGQQVINALLGVGALLLAVLLVMNPGAAYLYWLLVLTASVLGVLLVIPIGGADMPVVISLLNSYSGLAAAATGFVLYNNVLIITGSLVGASGIILTRIMCKAMNRSLTHVLFGVLGPTSETATADEIYAGKVKAATPDEVALLFDTARRAVIVPGYGMAVAQAQHAVRDLTNLLESRGCEVEFAIHPVAGRMPGHMNVLLAEANIPYEKLKEMDEVNPTFEQTDVALVIGANDVVNPLARTDPHSPIAGMPILNVDYARTVVVVKRSLSPGFAGIPNPLFAADNTLMMFGDGKKALLELIAALKAA